LIQGECNTTCDTGEPTCSVDVFPVYLILIVMITYQSHYLLYLIIN